MKKVLFIVAIATLFFSCQREINPSKPSDPNSSKGFSFTAGIEDFASPTRADLGSGNTLVWAQGDQIGIYVNDPDWGDKNQAFNLQGEGGTTTGSFVWNEDDGNFTSELATIAFFPWQGSGDAFNHVYDGIVYFEMPSGYYEYTSGQLLTPLVAPLTYENGGYSPISFKHAGAAVKVVINNLPAGVHSLGLAEVSDQAQNLSGEFSINPANAGTDAIAPVQGNNNAVWLNIEPSSDEREFTFIFPVPELTAPKFAFSMYDQNDVLVWQKILKPQPNNLERGQVLEMPAIDITPYAKFLDANGDAKISEEWTVIGTVNGTSWNADIPMVTDGTICIAKGVSFAANGEFKVRQNKSWDAPNVNYPSSNYVVTNAGTYDIIFDSSDNSVKAVATGCPYPEIPVTVGIDGDMSEWASVPGTVRETDSSNAIEQVKAYADNDYVYVYVKRAKVGRYSQVWGSNVGYYYYDFELDGNPETGEPENSHGNFDAWCYLFPFGASEGEFVSEPSVHAKGMTINNVICGGSVTDSAIEVEVAFPRENFPVISSQTISVSVYGNKDANPLTSTYFSIKPVEHTISIDGDMSDWAKVSGSTTTGIIKAFKMWNDDENFYFYNSCEPGSRGAELWNGGGYYYYDFNLDNDSTTGDYTEGDNEAEPYYEATLAIFPFGGTASEPAINNPLSFYKPKGVSTDGITLKGAITDDLIEVEFVIPRANFETQVQTGDIITVYNWRAKGGNSTTLTYTVQ